MRLRILAALCVLVLLSCKNWNKHPLTPDAPTGPEVCYRLWNLEFTTVTTDPNGQQISYRFDWDDGDTSEWSAYLESGRPYTAEHTYQLCGRYEVRSQARDPYTLSYSDWSDAFEAVVSDSPATVLWTLQVGRGRSSPAVGEDGTIYICQSGGMLHAVAPDGSERWQVQAAGGATTPSIGADGTIYVASDSFVQAYGPDGTELWEFKTGYRTFSSTAVGADGTVYVCYSYGGLYALNPDGTLKWNLPECHSWDPPTIGADGTIYVSCYNDTLRALSPEGALLWWYATDRHIYTSPVVGADGTIYAAFEHPHDCGSVVHAFSANGRLMWQYWVQSENIEGPPVIGLDGTIYYGTWGCDGPEEYGTVTALNPDGSLKWKLQCVDVYTSLALGSDSTLYAVADGEWFYAVSTDGAVRWRLPIPKGTDASPALTEGTIYFTLTDGNLYAVACSGGLADSPWPMFQHNPQHTGRAR